jgi:hypothetical protein
MNTTGRAVMTALPVLADRVVKARWEGTCIICRGPILIGQYIARCPGRCWAHCSCWVRDGHRHNLDGAFPAGSHSTPAATSAGAKRSGNRGQPVNRGPATAMPASRRAASYSTWSAPDCAEPILPGQHITKPPGRGWCHTGCATAATPAYGYVTNADAGDAAEAAEMFPTVIRACRPPAAADLSPARLG